jgi:hypothetical protein
MMISATRDQSDGDFKYKFFQAMRPLYFSCDSRCSIVDRRRMNNSHQKTDVMSKWQNNHLSVQASWKEMDRYYPFPTSYINSAELGYLVDVENDVWHLNRRNRQLSVERDLLVGYRNDLGNLNWGIQLDYKYQTKDFRWEDGPRNDMQGFVISTGMVWSTYDTQRWGLTVDASYKLGERNMLEFRGGMSREKLTIDGNKWNHPDNLNEYSVRMGHDYAQTHVSLQLQDTFTMDNDFWLTLVARANKVQGGDVDNTLVVYSTGAVAPNGFNKDLATDGGNWNNTIGLALKKDVTENLTFKTTWGTFVRYPNFYELFGDGVYIRPSYMYLNEIPLPQPEKGNQWDFTAEWRGELPLVGIQGNFSATYYNRRTKNMIGLFQTPYFVYYGNYGKTRASGVEFEGGLNFTYIDIALSATWLESEVFDLAKTNRSNNSYSLWFSEGSEILNSPQWETHARVDFRVPRAPLSVFAEHHFTDKVPIAFQASSAMRYEERLSTVNLGFRAEPLDGLRLTAGVNDFFNKTPKQGAYEGQYLSIPARPKDTLLFPKEGRVYYATLQYAF